MVEGTGLENQRSKDPQVRILSLPPKLSFLSSFGTVAQLVRA